MNELKIIEKLEIMYPDADTELEFSSVYELLVAVMLSAQCTDKRVNTVTRELFKEYSTAEKMITLSQEELEKRIFSCGFYKNKAKNILATSKILVEEFDGEVPGDWNILQSLPEKKKKIGIKIPAARIKNHLFKYINTIIYVFLLKKNKKEKLALLRGRVS